MGHTQTTKDYKSNMDAQLTAKRSLATIPSVRREIGFTPTDYYYVEEGKEESQEEDLFEGGDKDQDFDGEEEDEVKDDNADAIEADGNATTEADGSVNPMLYDLLNKAASANDENGDPSSASSRSSLDNSLDQFSQADQKLRQRN